jgi:hypothetical protein
MNWTFGICAGNLSLTEVGQIYWSICHEANRNMNPVDTYEILFIGKQPENGHWGEFCRWIDFDETQKAKPWITRKKNIIAQEARFENIVFMHDYFRLGHDWFEGWEYFGNKFDVACNCIMTAEGYRHSDWVVDPLLLWSIKPELKDKFWDVSLRYEEDRYTTYQYISGGYWVAKKQFMLDNPLDETLVWGEYEDIEWSRRVRVKTQFKFNPYSFVKITKPGKWAPGMLPMDYLVDLVTENK